MKISLYLSKGKAMREYYIATTDLGYKVYREKEENGIKTKEWRQGNTYTLNKEFAKTYYHMNEATSALVTARIQGKKIPTTSVKKSEYEDTKGKKLCSWG